MSKTRPPDPRGLSWGVRAVRPGPIRTWVAQVDRDTGKRSYGLRTEEHEEIRRLRRENRRLREEREILAKLRPGSRGRPDPGGLPVHERESGPFPYRHDGPGARCLHERVLRVASTSTLSSRAGRCGPDDPRAGDSRLQPWDVRRPPDSRGTIRSRRRGESQACGAGDALGGHCGREPSPRSAHDAAGFTGPAGSGSGRSPLRGGRAESPVGCRHHLHPDARRLPLLGHRPRRVQPAGRGLGDGGSSPHGLGARRAGDGGGATAAGLGHPSLGPRLPVHVAGLRRPVPGVGGRAIDGLGGRLLRLGA